VTYSLFYYHSNKTIEDFCWQGWLDLASARHSMGASRISSSLFDLKVQSAATTVQVSESIKEPKSGIS